MFEPVRFGKYLLIERIATGGMAEVYKAKSYGVMGFEKLLVIKKILPHLSRSREFVSLFINEAKVSVSLNHGNIVQVYDLGVVGTDYYIAMEYVHGADLMRTMRKAAQGKQRLPIPLACFVVSEMARGLEYAHTLTDPTGRALNVVHRDISPHNVLLSYQGDVKLFDFGIAQVGKGVAARVPGGKYAYMSPEHLGVAPIDSRSDIYSTGIVLFELVTGKRLYAGMRVEEKKQAILDGTIPRPSSINAEVDPALEEIIFTALARDPDFRFQSAAEMQDRLLGYLLEEAQRSNRFELGAFLRELFATEFARDAAAGSVINNFEPEYDALAEERGGPGADGARAPRYSPPPLGTAESDKGLQTEPSRSRTTASGLSGSEMDSLDGGEDSLDASRFTLSEVTGSASGVDSGSLEAFPGSPGGRLSEGERREVYILAADVVGMDQLAERRDEEELLRHNYRFLKGLVQVVRRYKGALDRFYNDRFLVFWGLGRAAENDRALCLDCAQALARFSNAGPLAGKVGIRLCMGVHRGTLVAGARGRRLRRFVPLGDTLKLATRLAEAAEPDEVLISERVVAHAPDQGCFEAVEPLRIKGRPEPLPVFRLSDDPALLAGDALAGRWIPRADEIDVLAGVLDRVGGGEPVVLVATAEAGAGKTRFLHEVQHRATEQGFSCYLGLERHHGGEQPLLPIADVLRQLAGLESRAGESVQRERLLKLGERHGLSAIQIHLLGTLLGVEFEDSPLRYLAVDQRVADMFRALTQLLESVAAATPTVVALRNLQWTDRQTREFVRHLHRRLGPDCPLLLAVSLRLEDELPVDEVDERVVELRLPGWGREEILAYCREFLGVAEVPRALVDVVDEASGGNALFAKELLRSLARENRLRIDEGRVRIEGALNPADVPDSVQDLIKSRLDALGRQLRLVLEVAAAVGRQFPVDVVTTVLGSDPAQMEGILDELVATDLIRPRTGKGVGASYRFRNIMTWEVTYRGIIAARRRELHARVGDSIERLRAAALRPHYEVLYAHFKEGGQLARAASYAEAAAQTHADQNYVSDAIRCYEQAILLLRGAGDADDVIGRRLSRIHGRLAELAIDGGDPREAHRHGTMALDYAADAEALEEEARGLLVMCHVEEARDEEMLVEAYLERLAELVPLIGDPAARAEILERHALLLIERGELAGARGQVELALRGAPTADSRLRHARLLCELGDLQLRREAPNDAQANFARAIKLARGLGDKALLGRIHLSIGRAKVRRGRLADARDSYQRSYRAYKKIEYRRGIATTLLYIGDLLVRTGSGDKARRYLTRARDLAEAVEWVQGVDMADVYSGCLEAVQGDEGGRGRVDTALARAEARGDALVISRGSAMLAWILFADGEKREAEALRLRAKEAAETFGDPGFASRAPDPR